MNGSGRHMAFPFRIGADGRTAAPRTLQEHIAGEVVQLLLTSRGERPFLPSFGGGLKRLVFERNDEASAAVVKSLISQSVSTWLGHRVHLTRLEVTAVQSTLTIDVRYRIVVTGEEWPLRFQHEDSA